MISVKEAQLILDGIEVNPTVEEIPVTDSLGRVAAEDIVSRIEMPPFNKAAMDGYAVNSKDKSKKFRIIETIAAGDKPKFGLKKTGECSEIMTGAHLPDGADMVIRVELTKKPGDFMIYEGGENSGNVCIKGEDISVGDIVINKGTLMEPQHMGIAASVGRKSVMVYTRVRASIICTGDEIMEPGSQLSPGKIYNSNLYSLRGQLLREGVVPVNSSGAGDDPGKLKSVISGCIDGSDILFLTGGVSMGKYDYVPEILEEMGFSIYFHKVKVKPGKPTLFAGKNGKFVLGLPGNPVSSFIIFEIFAKPFIYKMCGHSYSPRFSSGIMGKDYFRKKSGREQYVPVRLNEKGEIEQLEFHGSAHLGALNRANALLRIEEGRAEISKGSVKVVRQI